jgi:hypothetical protein
LAITSVSIAIGFLIIVFGRSALKAADRIPTPEEDLLAMEYVEQTPPINSQSVKK